jgi:hypothetical protein
VCIMRALHFWQLLIVRVQGYGSEHFDSSGILLKLAEQVGEEHGTGHAMLLL